MEERLSIWKVAANDKGRFSSLGVGRGANNSSPLKRILLRNIHKASVDILFVKLYYWNYPDERGPHVGHPCSKGFMSQSYCKDDFKCYFD
jgi:hypothetical protein